MDVIKELKSITPISNETKQKLRRKTAFSLPDNPSARKMKPNEIKKYLYAAIVDFDDKYIEKDPSIIGIIETLISEVSENFTNLDAYWEASFEYIESRINDVEDKLDDEKTAREQAVKTISDNLGNTNANLSMLTQKVNILGSAGFVTKEVANLVNYYLKSEVYNKTEIDGFIELLKGLGISFKTVNELPETGENKHIYLVPAKNSADKNFYTEWIWVNGAWEYIGSTDINLSDYYTKTQTDEKLSKYALKHFEGTRAEFDEALEAGNILDGMICIIQEESGAVTVTTSVLGKAILGQMILGT